ncbi:hypothetical protein M427DRAFT_38817 [Gonapodya prolifera JEL478]|uniref:Pal1-domain-containing protein n=1 Tax=Gonapodya prolifera (strain JEL478) TaxID=1344416 RepID=A0A138ZZC1_GONPJ|nr:hypothetical protein M427DRAFT_38817 [Gonapodya prolifera JEL478]|eukprot:KXS09483.1 hypothetical protein M427DRAFT_38817 [Gonapodya prolifera JEL478]
MEAADATLYALEGQDKPPSPPRAPESRHLDAAQRRPSFTPDFGAWNLKAQPPPGITSPELAPVISVDLTKPTVPAMKDPKEMTVLERRRSIGANIPPLHDIITSTNPKADKSLKVADVRGPPPIPLPFDAAPAPLDMARQQPASVNRAPSGKKKHQHSRSLTDETLRFDQVAAPPPSDFSGAGASPRRNHLSRSGTVPLMAPPLSRADSSQSPVSRRLPARSPLSSSTRTSVSGDTLVFSKRTGSSTILHVESRLSAGGLSDVSWGADPYAAAAPPREMPNAFMIPEERPDEVYDKMDVEQRRAQGHGHRKSNSRTERSPASQVGHTPDGGHEDQDRHRRRSRSRSRSRRSRSPSAATSPTERNGGGDAGAGGESGAGGNRARRRSRSRRRRDSPDEYAFEYKSTYNDEQKTAVPVTEGRFVKRASSSGGNSTGGERKSRKGHNRSRSREADLY